jgi:hypothetical protein
MEDLREIGKDASNPGPWKGPTMVFVTEIFATEHQWSPESVHHEPPHDDVDRIIRPLIVGCSVDYQTCVNMGGAILPFGSTPRERLQNLSKKIWSVPPQSLRSRLSEPDARLAIRQPASTISRCMSQRGRFRSAAPSRVGAGQTLLA